MLNLSLNIKQDFPWLDNKRNSAYPFVKGEANVILNRKPEDVQISKAKAIDSNIFCAFLRFYTGRSLRASANRRVGLILAVKLILSFSSHAAIWEPQKS